MQHNSLFTGYFQKILIQRLSQSVKNPDTKNQHYPTFTAYLAAQGRELPDYLQREFDEYLKCSRLEHGFLRVRYESCHVEHLVAFCCKD